MIKYRLSDGLTKKQRLRKSKMRGRMHERQSAQVDREMGYIVKDLDKHTTGYDYRRKNETHILANQLGDGTILNVKQVIIQDYHQDNKK